MKALICGDLHVPSHDARALECVLGYLKGYRPDYFIFLGDLTDFDMFSRFLQDPRKRRDPQREIERARETVKRFEGAAGAAKLVFLKGNHEARLEKYIQRNAPNLMYLECLDLVGLLGLEKWKVYDYPHYARLGKLIVQHGEAYGASVCERNVAKFGSYNVVQGHSHRLAQVFVRRVDGVFSSVQAGCLCSLSPSYTQRPNWQQGFVTYDRGQLKTHLIVRGDVI